MAVTNYYSVNGLILGEKSTGGSRVDYLPDALGSVTATVNNTAQVVNTYRYKPYGTQLTRTGTGNDPLFRWAGMFGYAHQGKSSAQVYVRTRHYATDAGRWTTQDPIGYGDGLNLYAYVRNRVFKYVDPSGMQTILPPVGSVTYQPGPVEAGVWDSDLWKFNERYIGRQPNGPGIAFVIPAWWWRIFINPVTLTAGVILCTAKAAGPTQAVVDEYLKEKKKKKKSPPKQKRRKCTDDYDYCDEIHPYYPRYYGIRLVNDCRSGTDATFVEGLEEYYKSIGNTAYIGNIARGPSSKLDTANSCYGKVFGNPTRPKVTGRHDVYYVKTINPDDFLKQGGLNMVSTILCCPCCRNDDDEKPVFKIGVSAPHL